MFGMNQDAKSVNGQRKSKRRNYTQYCQESPSTFNQENDYLCQDNQYQCVEDNSYLIRDKLKPYENDFECEGMQFQPIIIDQQLLKDFSLLHKIQNLEYQQNQIQSDLYSKDRKFQTHSYNRPSGQIEAHIQYLMNQKRIPEEKARIIQAQLYNYYNQINKF